MGFLVIYKVTKNGFEKSVVKVGVSIVLFGVCEYGTYIQKHL